MTGHIFFDAELFQGIVSDFDRFLLHLFRHVDVFDDWFELADGGTEASAPALVKGGDVRASDIVAVTLSDRGARD